MSIKSLELKSYNFKGRRNAEKLAKRFCERYPLWKVSVAPEEEYDRTNSHVYYVIQWRTPEHDIQDRGCLWGNTFKDWGIDKVIDNLLRVSEKGQWIILS